MYQNLHKNNYRLTTALVISILVIFLLFIWQGNNGFNMWDEGFLWYGVQRVMLGEVPIRDFMAYDPGRYYWSAALMSVIGDNGIMSLRATVALFQALGLFVAILLITESAKSHRKYDLLYWILSAATLVIWMFPRHKLFDISLSIFLVGILAFLIRNPIPKRYFIAGVCVGLVAVFGRNHGMYGFAGGIGVMLWLSIKRTEGAGLIKGFALWSAGVVLGYIPVILMVLVVPGFAGAFLEWFRFLIETGNVNLPLPVPWPWGVNFASVSSDEAIRGVLIGLFFIATLVFGVLSIIWVVRQKIRNERVSPVLAATAFLALPYAHHAYSRADVGHLAQSIFPLLIGCLVLLGALPAKFKWPLAITFCVASFWIMHSFQPGWQCWASKQCVNIEISGNKLLVDPVTANNIEQLHKLADQYASGGQNIIVTPLLVSAYPLLERRSPMRDIFGMKKRSPDFERAEIERNKAANPGFVLVFDLALDGREELRYKNTHPLVYQYILENFERIPDSPEPTWQLFRAKVKAP